ncbi:MAG: NifB/NifX family molybdenum-iron cluster-binding protein [Chloroflexota bacterium]|jgi:predicted Fe-Mo cluster-binding NifX family protein|nr:NifB/NifX family molybdenum-iron cluster-binding protein [Chloroflexota bacterium]
MKIAAVTDDGKTISAHFGRARAYVVVTVEDGKATERELRSKVGHHDFVHEPHEHGEHEHEHEHGRGHGWGAEAEGRHARMFAAIADCDVLLARGMGQGAYAGLQQAGIRPFVTTVEDIDAAVQSYLDGGLEDHPEKLH